MAQVEASVVIRAPLDRVYALAKDVETFPEFMPDLKSVTVLERSGADTVTAWVGVVEGRTIRWIEDDHWDDGVHTCQFRQREGDFQTYEGVWRFEPSAEGTRTSIEVEFAFSIPLIGPLLSTLLRVKMRENALSMLGALKERLEGAP